jgi:hypothetical protein
MRQAFLILAHHGPDRLAPLVDRLLASDGGDHAVLHVDRRAPVADAALHDWAAGYAGRLRLAPRVPCRWGHRSLVGAMAGLIAAAEAESYDYAHLISGQDWPVLRPTALRARIAPGRAYLSFEQPDMAERMTGYHFNDFMLGPNAHRTALHYRLDLALRRAGRSWTRLRGPRACPVGPAWRKGSQWWSLPRAALAFAAPRLRAMIDGGHLRHTQCSDEHVMQTVLAASPFADRIADDNRRFIRWGARSSPDVLTRADAEAVRASDAWFMRKVDAAQDDFFRAF